MVFKLSILVGVDRDTGAKVSIVVPAKGATGKYTSSEVVHFLNEQGCSMTDRYQVRPRESITYVVDDVLIGSIYVDMKPFFVLILNSCLVNVCSSRQ